MPRHKIRVINFAVIPFENVVIFLIKLAEFFSVFALIFPDRQEQRHKAGSQGISAVAAGCFCGKPKESDSTLNAAISVKSFGVILLIIGFLSDIIGMFMVVGSGDVDTFKIVLLGGTISFFLGLILTFVG